MKIFKILRELRFFRKYIDNVETFSKTEIFKQYRFSTGAFGQFGSIIRLEKMDVTNMKNQIDDDMIKTQLVKYLEAFFEGAENYGLHSEVLAYKIEHYITDDTKRAKKYFFVKVEFQFLWNYLSVNYIISRILFFVILGILIKYFPFNLFKGLL